MTLEYSRNKGKPLTNATQRAVAQIDDLQRCALRVLEETDDAVVQRPVEALIVLQEAVTDLVGQDNARVEAALAIGTQTADYVQVVAELLVGNLLEGQRLLVQRPVLHQPHLAAHLGATNLVLNGV